MVSERFGDTPGQVKIRGRHVDPVGVVVDVHDPVERMVGGLEFLLMTDLRNDLGTMGLDEGAAHRQDAGRDPLLDALAGLADGLRRIGGTWIVMDEPAMR